MFLRCGAYSREGWKNVPFFGKKSKRKKKKTPRKKEKGVDECATKIKDS